ncbi:hypothetical protein [Thalassotalea maritima]|uniref:hypothetical protein n=1 Tax=Thalassotalea maritima TaxID=3242416 RepID=UPI003527943F
MSTKNPKAKIKSSSINKKVITKADGSKEYHLEFEIENVSDDDITIVISDNPWWPSDDGGMGPKAHEDRSPWLDKDGNQIIDPATGKAASKPDVKKQRKKSLQRWKNPDADGDPTINEHDPLRIPKQGKKKVVLIYEREPWATYADIYVVPEDFEITEDVDEQADLPEYDDHLTRTWKTVSKQSFYWQGPHSTEAFAYALPYPMIVHDSHHGDIEIVIDEITGLPPGVQLVHAFPAIGIAYRLECGDRGTSGCLHLKQTQYTPPGDYVVGVRYHVHCPRRLSNIERVSQFDLRIPEAERDVDGFNELLVGFLRSNQSC